MNATHRELLRQAMLQALVPVPVGLGLSAPGLRIQVIAVGHTVPEADVAAELQYLADKGLVAPLAKTLSPENRLWRITAEGRDLLASLGLA